MAGASRREGRECKRSISAIHSRAAASAASVMGGDPEDCYVIDCEVCAALADA
jgi:hypothetical protein